MHKISSKYVASFTCSDQQHMQIKALLISCLIMNIIEKYFGCMGQTQSVSRLYLLYLLCKELKKLKRRFVFYFFLRALVMELPMSRVDHATSALYLQDLSPCNGMIYPRFYPAFYYIFTSTLFIYSIFKYWYQTK